MGYRVTNNMMQSLLMNDMHKNLNKLLDIQQQLTTQRKYSSASQNPNAVTKGMSLDTMMTEGTQYKKNLQDAITWLKFTDSALGSINDVFQRVRELAVYAGDGALEDVDLAAIAEELKALKEEIMSYANSTIAGEYLFAGLMTSTLPFSLVNGEVVYNGNDYTLNWEFARQQTGQVSVTGSDIFPENEATYSLKGIEVPLDFEWSGRGEILEFKVGWRTVKVRIPEKWTDENIDSLADPTDYNRYRDSGELEGYSLQEIADLINNSTEMGDVGKLLKASVVTDADRGVQYLVIKSHTGESVQLTSWPETDLPALSQGVMGAAYGPIGRTAAVDGTLSFRFGLNTVYDVDVEAGDSLADIAQKLNDLPDGKLWASYKNDGANEWIDIVARETGDQFTLETTGGAVSLFAPQMVTASSQESSGTHSATTNAYSAAYDFSALSGGSLVIRQGNQTYTINTSAGNTLGDIAGAINTDLNPPFTAKIENGALVIESQNDTAFEVTAIGGLVPLFSDGAAAKSGTKADDQGYYTLETKDIPAGFVLPGVESGLSFTYDGENYFVPLNGNEDMDDIAAALQAALDVAAAGATPAPKVTVKTDVGENGVEVQRLVVETDKQIVLSGFGGAADVIGTNTVGSEAISVNSDHTHIGFAALMGMETAVKSTELTVGENDTFDTTTDPLHIKFVSGSNSGEVFINDLQSMTLEDLAKRINGVCGSWLQAVVEIDEPDGTTPSADPLNNSQDNQEKATARLVLRTLDGEPFAIYDGPGQDGAPAADYAQLLGINTALMGESMDPNGLVTYPDAAGGSSFEESMPAILEVTVGDKVFTVKVCKNNCPTAEKVAAAIVRQVNEQYGSTLLAWDANDIKNDPNGGTFALYAVTGEPLRVVDKGYGDPRYSDFTGGVAMQLGIAAGITTSANLDYNDTYGDGLIRISTPGHTIEVPVLANDTLHSLANRIRDYAGEWLDVSFASTEVGSGPGITNNGTVNLTIAAKDGSAVTVFDIEGSVASQIGLDTGVVGTADLTKTNFPVAGDYSDDATLTITVNGASHTIDLIDTSVTPPQALVNSVEDLADLINTRFQGQDIRAEVLVTKDANGVVTGKRLALSSPKGYTFTLSGTGTIGGTAVPERFGFVSGQPSPNGDTTPFNQQTTVRTGNNVKQTNFFGVMDNLISTVEAGNVDGLSDIMLSKLDDWMANLLKNRAQVGALINRYTTTESRYTANNTSYTELYTQVVGVDLAEVITNYEMAMGIYEASLAAIARIMQPTLLDFLR